MDIEVTIPPQAFNFNKYTDPRDCYLAEALKKLGYQLVEVGGIGYTRIDGINYRPKFPFSARILELNFLQGVDTHVTLTTTK